MNQQRWVWLLADWMDRKRVATKQAQALSRRALSQSQYRTMPC